MAVGKISELVDPSAIEQLEQLYQKLGITTQRMVEGTEAAAGYINAIGKVNTITEFNAANQQAVTILGEVKQAQQQFLAVNKEVSVQTDIIVNKTRDNLIAAELKKQEAFEKTQNKYLVNLSKQEAARQAADAKEIAAAEAKAAKLQAIADKAAAEQARKAAVQFPQSKPSINPVTQEPAPGQGAVSYTPIITGQEDMALKATKSTEVLNKESAALLEQKEILESLSASQRANIENLLALQIERAANAAELKKLNIQDAASGERAVFFTAEQMRLKTAIAEVTFELSRQTKEMLSENGSVKEMTASLELLRNAYFELGTAERESSQGQKMLAEINLLDLEVKKLRMSVGDTSKEVGAYEKAIAKATSGTQLATQAVTIATRSIVRMIVQFALFGVIFEAVQALYEYIKALNIFNPIASEAEMRQKALQEAFSSSEYEKGLENVLKLGANLELVNKGVEDSDTAINQYNETIGKTFGYVNNINDAQQGFIDHKDAYIDTILQEAAAQALANDAAKEAAEIYARNAQLQEQLTKDRQQRTQVLKNASENTPESTRNLLRQVDNLIKDDLDQINENNTRIKQIFDRAKAAIVGVTANALASGGQQTGQNAAAELRNKIANEELEAQKIHAQNLINNEKLSYATRFQAAKDFYMASRQIEINNENLALSELPKNDARREDVEKDAANKLLQIEIAYGNQRQSLIDKQYKQDQEILKNNIEKQKDLFKQISEDPNQSYSMKIIALDIYNKKSIELINANYEEQRKAAGKNTESLKIAEQVKDKALIELANQTSAERIKIVKEETSKILEASKESEQEQIEALDRGEKSALRVLSDARDEAESKLAEQLEKRKITQRKHDRELLRINDEYNIALLAQEIATQQSILAIKEGQRDSNLIKLKQDGASPDEIAKAKSAGDKDVQSTFDRLQELIDKYNKAKAKKKTDDAKIDPSNQQAYIFALEQAMKAVDELDKMRQQAYENEIVRLENLSKIVDENAAAEKQRVNDSILSSKEKARENAIIDAQANRDKQNLQAQENKIKQKEAIADKEAAIAKIILNTAIAAIKAPAELGPILGLAAVPVVLALGAAELAAAAAAPIPKFEKGGTVAKDGPIITGEAGTELRIDPSGQYSLTAPYENVTYAKAGTKIISNKELQRIVGKPEPIYYVNDTRVDNRKLEKLMAENNELQKRQKRPIVNVHTDRWGDYSRQRNY